MLEVPSAVVADEHIYLLNPAHPDFARIVADPPALFHFDPRLVPLGSLLLTVLVVGLQRTTVNAIRRFGPNRKIAKSSSKEAARSTPSRRMTAKLVRSTIEKSWSR